MDSQDTNTMKNITTLHMVAQEQQTTQCTLPEPNLSPSLKDNTLQDKEIVLSWILSEWAEADTSAMDTIPSEDFSDLYYFTF